MKAMKRISFNQGFTLIELAIVLIILGLLITGLLVPLTEQANYKRRTETTILLAEAKQALLGYTLVNQHMPCPDITSGGDGSANNTANDGVEDFDPATGSCRSQGGNLPWATLSLVETDAWGTVLTYRVAAAFSDRSPLVVFDLLDNGSVRICNQAACNAPRLTDTAVAAIISYGANRGICAGICADEAENSDGDANFVSHAQADSSAAGGEFDDQVVWLSPNVLFNAMVSAEQLP